MRVLVFNIDQQKIDTYKTQECVHATEKKEAANRPAKKWNVDKLKSYSFVDFESYLSTKDHIMTLKFSTTYSSGTALCNGCNKEITKDQIKKDGHYHCAKD